jgi:hypothetical protein
MASVEWEDMKVQYATDRILACRLCLLFLSPDGPWVLGTLPDQRREQNRVILSDDVSISPLFSEFLTSTPGCNVTPHRTPSGRELSAKLMYGAMLSFRVLTFCCLIFLDM